MPVLMRFLRNVPGPELHAYLSAHQIRFPESINWEAGDGGFLKLARRAVSSLAPAGRERVRVEAERMDRMTSEIGQTALIAVATDRQQNAVCTENQILQ